MADQLNNVRVSEEMLEDTYCKIWWKEACLRAWKHKKVVFNKFKKKRDLGIFIAFKKARAQLRRVIIKAK